jgi:elongation factor G
MTSLLKESASGAKKTSPLARIRNLGIVAHIDSGKTTITERMLKIGGKIRAMGEVHDGEATMDFLKEERERGITIGSASTYFIWQGCNLNLIDTPGHVDFTAEVERSLRVLDGAVLAIDSVAGAQAQSETVNRQLNKYGVPRLVFVNKMDRVGADFARAVDSLSRRLALNVVPIQLPVGQGPDFRAVVDLVAMDQVSFPEKSDDPAAFVTGPIEEAVLEEANTAHYKLLETLAMFSDELMELVLEESEPPPELVVRVLRWATIHGGLVPVLMGSALRNRGVPALLDAAVAYLPSPLDKGRTAGIDPRSGAERSFEPSPDEPFSAVVFKTVHFATGDLTFLRLYSGRLENGQAAYNPRLGKHERVGRLFLVHANSREPVEEAHAGQIVACMGLKSSATGDTLCTKGDAIAYGSTTFASPVISMAIEPVKGQDRDRLGEVLGIITREDPTFQVHIDEETGQTLISGMGELHLEVIAHRLRDDFGLVVETGKPRVSYRQTIVRKATVDSRHIKQTGGSGQYAVARVEFEPIEGDQVEFTDTIKGGRISAEFLRAMEKAVHDHCLSGGRRGVRLQGLRATVVDGKMHDVDSSQIAFYACGALAVRLAEEACGLKLLEPIMRVVVTVPEDYLGSVIGDLNARSGVILDIGNEGLDKQVSARVPLRTLPAYATTLRSVTSGRGSYVMEPDGYQPVPLQVVETLEL